jgi:threonyl-tRNA synthetase
MGKEQTNTNNMMKDWRRLALESGFKKADPVKITEEDLLKVEASISQHAKENLAFRTRSIINASKFYVG